MVLAIELTPEQEERFRLGVAQRDESQVRDVLVVAMEDYMQSLLRFAPLKLTEQEWDHLADELVELVETGRQDSAQPLSDFALSREGIYADHP
ncbi:iron-containing alcohol dehydrogenase [Anaerolineae bacterium CFX7]|nr:iron-containing alcohol dehydrogenase [Anaerolineae bacterium CFX7]